MQPHQLKYFVSVAEEGSFTTGALRVRVVQSAVSAAVRQLERELNSSLFVRGRHVGLTPEGEALLPRAREVLASIEAAGAAVAAARGRVTGSVSLGMIHHFATFDVAGRLASFQRNFPDVTVHARSSAEGARGYVEALRRGDLDLAFITSTDALSGLHLRHLDCEPFRFVCSASHRLAGAGTVRLEEIAGEAFIDLPAGWGSRSVVESAFAEAGLRRTVRTEAVDFTMAQALACAELGVTFVPASAVSADGRVVGLDAEPELTWTAWLAWSASRPLSPAAAALVSEFESDMTAVEERSSHSSES